MQSWQTTWPSEICGSTVQQLNGSNNQQHGFPTFTGPITCQYLRAKRQLMSIEAMRSPRHLLAPYNRSAALHFSFCGRKD